MNASKFLRLSLSAALLTGVVGMTGCGMNTKGDVRTQSAHNQNRRQITPYSNNNQNGPYSYNNQNGQYSQKGVNGMHKINSMRFSSALSNKVAKLPGVSTAHVVLTDNDAYVAVRLMNNHTSYNNRNNMSTNMNRNNAYRYGVNGTSGTNNAYGTRGNTIAGDLGNAGRDIGRGVANTGRDIVSDVAGAGRNVVNNVGNMGHNMANDLTGNRGMNRGHNYDTGMNNYNTNNMNNMNNTTDQVPQHLREQITRTIKQANKVVKKVYISNDESFFNEVGGYVTNSSHGGVVGDTMTGFERLVNRIFPFSNEPYDGNNYHNNMNSNMHPSRYNQAR